MRNKLIKHLLILLIAIIFPNNAIGTNLVRSDIYNVILYSDLIVEGTIVEANSSWFKVQVDTLLKNTKCVKVKNSKLKIVTKRRFNFIYGHDFNGKQSHNEFIKGNKYVFFCKLNKKKKVIMTVPSFFSRIRIYDDSLIISAKQLAKVSFEKFEKFSSEVLDCLPSFLAGFKISLKYFRNVASFIDNIENQLFENKMEKKTKSEDRWHLQEKTLFLTTMLWDSE